VTVPNALAREGLLSTAEVAKKLRVHRSTVWIWINSGTLRATRSGGTGTYFGVHPRDLREFQKRWSTAGDKRA